MERNHLLIIFSVIASVLFLLSFSYSVGKASWDRKVLDTSVRGFVDVEVGEKVHVVARTREGLEHYYRQLSSLPFVDRGNFSSGIISSRDHAGSYASLELVGGKPAVAYQYAKIGDERARYAVKKDGDWNISDVSSKGRNNGMYSELAVLDGEPVVFYTNDFKEPLVMARKKGGWETRRLEKNAGLLTDAESCDGELKVAYADRNTNGLNLGTFDGSWSSRSVGINATSLDLALNENCDASMILHSDRENAVYTWSEGGRTKLDNSLFSRVSADFNGELHYAFGKRGRGLSYGISSNFSTLAGGGGVGNFNDIEVENGNRYLAFTDGSKLVYMEYRTSDRRKERLVLNAFRLFTGLLAVSLPVFTGWRNW